jgi:hypothetical protein
MEKPTSGDCLLCQLAAQDTSYKDKDHILSHIEENYLVPSLIWAAREYAWPALLRDIQSLQYKTGERVFSSHLEKDIKRLLRRYFKSQNV